MSYNAAVESSILFKIYKVFSTPESPSIKGGKKYMHRMYCNGEIVIFWDSEKCYHARRCVTGSPKTFDINRRPWIDPSQAPSAEIWQAISKCPSGALSCVYDHGISVVFNEESSKSEAYDGEKLIGECDYIASSDQWTITHTEVSPEYGGKGIAKRLVYKVTEEAERRGAKIVPLCSYAAKVLTSEKGQQ